ncbi:MAG: molybdopterin-dependent oxidoreductase [Ferruginibacter sp.]
MNHYKEVPVSEKYIRKRTLLGIFFFVLFISGSVYAWNMLQDQPKDQGALKPLRKGLDMNEWIFANFFSNDHLSREYSLALAAPRVRVNGDAGLADAADTANWKLHLVRMPGDTLLISLDEIRSLPKTEIIFDFKCIEGWSQVTRWAGVRFSDFVKQYGLSKQSIMNYAALVTPDGKYYVGIDMASMMHPQTLLCYEMNGKALPLNQGYPLRLIIPVKYGVKHLKRIGTLAFDQERPKDYWYEQGYDYYCGL